MSMCLALTLIMIIILKKKRIGFIWQQSKGLTFFLIGDDSGILLKTLRWWNVIIISVAVWLGSKYIQLAIKTLFFDMCVTVYECVFKIQYLNHEIEWKGLSSSVWTSIVQSIEGLTRTKRWREGNSFFPWAQIALFSCPSFKSPGFLTKAEVH